jgi:2'-5' RNA ligase
VPAHVTLLHPFMAPVSIDAALRAASPAIAAASAPFDYRLDAIGRFP